MTDTQCPSQVGPPWPVSPAGTLTMNGALRRAAELHSFDQSYSGYLALA